MTQHTRTTFLGSVALAAFFLTANQSFAIEPGDFNATLAGASIGIPLGAAPPPGLYASTESFVGPNAVGTGQNGAAAGANGGHGLTVFGAAETVSLAWSTGYNIFGGSLVLAAIQPFFTVAGLDTNCASAAGIGCGTPPIAFGAGAGAFFENVHNTIWSSAVSWNLKNGWFTSLGFNLQGPDGSHYAGTLNQDYWTFAPTAAIAYLSKDWKIAVNADYEVHSASRGNTGTYAAVAANVPGVPAVAAPNGCVGFNCPGIGYTGGNQLFIDWSAEYKFGKLSFGPAGDFKFQTTADTPGSGWTCAALSASAFYGPSLSCGKATDISLGGIVSYDFGPAELQTWVVDSVYNKDDFDGLKIFSRLSFKLGGPPPAAPMATKAPCCGN
jgi:Putative MetA-pathway of phenol degradation